MGDNSHGFDNVGEIVHYLQSKKYKELNLNMKEFIKYIANEKNLAINNNTVIYASVEPSNRLKQDFYVTIDNSTYGVSCKMGSGNSVHQEKIGDFITYISTRLNATVEICNLWKIFAWGDGTTDGSAKLEKNDDGTIKGRFGNALYKKIFPEERKKIQAFIDANIRELLEHIFFVGKYNSKVDFVFHGTYKNARWVSKKKVLDFNISNAKKDSSACFTIGRMTTQQWNASLKGTQEDRRGQLQHKYGSMEEDFNALMVASASNTGTFAGDGEEFNFTKMLNSQKGNSIWKALLPEESDYSKLYAVKVSTNQMSGLSGAIVKTKSDAYVVKADLSREFLLKHEYALDEHDLLEIAYSVVPGTGVSIKLKDSKNFTFQKFTKESFAKAFGHFFEDVNLVMASTLIYSKDSEVNKNKKILEDFGFDLSAFVKTMTFNINYVGNIDKNFWDGARKWGQEQIISAIHNNKDLADNIFLGTGWFEEPYCATFIYSEGILTKEYDDAITVTNGSGRSSGNYTVVIKPK